ncbi:hypothetical protein Rhopal_007843-T1 [Rhodotorula paludigena]|uniref:Transcriptional regulator n=1 Tax=Rhodotorula paludigena TaxID=86838 RepID=A0AAV5GZ14_9BASI|nr:hypothetical protein Rhopal_007843-T1 [Rhodotorula paludigena]
MHELVRANPLGTLTTGIKHPKHPFLQSSHIPWVLDTPIEPAADGTVPLGTLRGHIARMNPQSKAMVESLAEGSVELTDDVLVLFTVPTHSYVTPKFYAATKPSTGKVVPTWNYSAVQAYGRLKLFHADDERSSSFLQQQISDLSAQEEASAGHDAPWQVSDAPSTYIKQLKRAIVGLEIEITRLEGKNKMSQELPLADREGVVAGFKALRTDASRDMATMVQQRSDEVEAVLAIKKARHA